MITNYLAPTSFVVTVSRMPNVEFFTQRASIPALTMNPVSVQSPITTLYGTGDRVSYADFDLGFIVDERMNNYLEILRWIEGLGSPESTDQYKKLEGTKDGTVSDISVVIHNSHKNPSIKMTLKNCFPVSLSSINLSVAASDIQYPEATATFRYDTFEIEQI